MYYNSFDKVNRETFSSNIIPVSLWKRDDNHLFHKNFQTISDRNGKKLCIKCIKDVFASNIKSSIYLSQMCEDLILLIKCERSKGVIKYIIGEFLKEDGMFIINELNKTINEILVNNIINLCITLLNKHFSIAENNQRLLLCQNFTGIIVNRVNESNVKIKPILKLLFFIFDDNLSVYSNVMLEELVDNNEKLKKFGNIIYKLDKESTKYLFPLFVRIIEYKPEKAIKELIMDKGLVFSAIFDQYSEELQLFRYILEFYIYISLLDGNYFGYLVLEDDKTRQNKLKLNILNGINKATTQFSKSSKYLRFGTEPNQIEDSKGVVCSDEFITENKNFQMDKLYNVNVNKSVKIDFLDEGNEKNNNLMGYESNDTRNINIGVLKNQEIRGYDANYNVLIIKHNEDSNYKLMRNIIKFLKNFLLYKKEDFVINKINHSGCSINSSWILDNGMFDIMQKITEWIIELLKNSIDIEIDNLVLDCILQVFTNSDCKISTSVSTLKANQEETSCNDIVDESNEYNYSFNENVQGRNRDIYRNKSTANLTKMDDQLIRNIKLMNIKSKRVTFKRIRNDNDDSLNLDYLDNEPEEIAIRNSSEIRCENNRSLVDECCIHMMFTIKHGKYLTDILLELLDDYLHRYVFIRNENNSTLYDEKYKYLVNNKNIIESVILKIINLIHNISDSIAMQSCPRQIYALCWFMEYIIIEKEIGESSCPPIPLFGSSNMDMIMQTINTDEPLEKALVLISKKSVRNGNQDEYTLSGGCSSNAIYRNNDNDIAASNNNEKNIQIMICNSIISLINELCICLKTKLENILNTQNYKKMTSIRIKELWKLNGTIYNRELLLEYFSYIILTMQKLNNVKGVNITKLMESTNLLFELYSSELSIREYGLLSLCQLNIIENIINTNNASLIEANDEFGNTNSNSEIDNKECEHSNMNKNDIFSLILVIDRRIKTQLDNDNDKNTHNIFAESKKKIEMFIYNKIGAKLVFKWLKSQSEINELNKIDSGQAIEIKKKRGLKLKVSYNGDFNDKSVSKDDTRKKFDKNCCDISENVLYKWITYIAKQLLNPILDENEINNRIKHISNSKIKQSLLLEDSVSNDTICLVISLLFFCYKYYPRHVYSFVLSNINEGEEASEINLEPNISLRTCRNIPTRILLYYSYILLNEMNENYSFEANSNYKVIVQKMLFNLVNTKIRKREWLLWHTTKFGKIEIFSKSLELLLREKNNIKDYNTHKNVEESFYKWIYDRITEYSKYQVSTEATYINFSVSPIIKGLIVNNISLIKYQIKHLIRLSSIKFSNRGLNNGNELEEYLHSLYVNLNIYLYSLSNYIRSNNNVINQLTIEEITLPIKLLLNNKDEYDNNLKYILTEIYLDFVNIFTANSRIEILISENDDGDTNHLLYIIITLIIEITSWINNVYNESNIAKLNIGKYLNIITNTTLEYLSGNFNGKCSIYKIRQLFINYLENDSTILLFKKIINYLIECNNQNNITVISGNRYLIVLSLVMFSILLKNINTVCDNEMTKLINTLIAHPTLLIHSGGNSWSNSYNKCTINGNVNSSNTYYCEYCINYGFCHNDNEVKLTTIICFLISILNNFQENDYINLMKNSNTNHKIIKDVYLHSIVNTFELMGISDRSEDSILTNRVMSQGYMSIITIILYFYKNKTLILSLVNNLYIQKYLSSCLIEDIKNNSEIFELNGNSKIKNFTACDEQKVYSMGLYYLTACSYLTYIIYSSPWWFNSCKELLTVPIIKAFGRLYKTSKLNYDNAQDDTWKHLHVMCEVLLRSMMKINTNSCLFESNDKQDSVLKDNSKIKQIYEESDIIRNDEYNNINNTENGVGNSGFNLFCNLIQQVLISVQEKESNYEESPNRHHEHKHGNIFQKEQSLWDECHAFFENECDVSKLKVINANNDAQICISSNYKACNRNYSNELIENNSLLIRILQFSLNLMYKKLLD
ncbi:hypothetical protein FG386_002142 [Cryptosporidium ryanae]|uniref:uncharacterized protein n=1 Tax=Cryptosporidium ryanae TaxID=515981 RepID=UPI00351A5A40|nr:hypothetical protein FG386_002142 [Cryptosporidium ryanae]